MRQRRWQKRDVTVTGVAAIVPRRYGCALQRVQRTPVIALGYRCCAGREIDGSESDHRHHGLRRAHCVPSDPPVPTIWTALGL